MIVVKLELWPGGREQSAREIGRTYIANDGGGTPKRGDYKVAVCRRGTVDVPREVYDPADVLIHESKNGKLPSATRAGTVKDYPRLAYNVWRLIARALLAAFPEEQYHRNTVRPALDEQVVRGLDIIRRQATGPLNPLMDTEMAAANAALEWLDAAKGDM